MIKDQALPVSDGNGIVVGTRERTVVHTDKFKGVSYVDVVDHLIKLRNASPVGGKSELVIDGTSIGRVVSDMLWEQGVDLKRYINAYERESASGNGFDVHHKVPLVGKCRETGQHVVCGLHVPWNLKVMERSRNQALGDVFESD